MAFFLDACLFLFAFYIITQQLLPAIDPGSFEKNWFFKRKKKHKPLLHEIENLSQQQAKLEEAADEVLNKSETQLKEAEALKQKAQKLKN